METIKKLLTLLISFIIAFSFSSVVGYATGNPRISTAQFFRELNEIVENENSGLGAAGFDEYSRRIIVKTDSNKRLDSQGATASIEGFNCWHVFQYDTISKTQAAIKYYESLPNVEYVELDCSVESEPFGISETYDDTPVFNVVPSLKDWGCKAVKTSDFLKKIAKFKNTPEVEVAVLDTGIDYDHPFFEDSSRLIDSKVNSTGFFSNDTSDKYGHGTLVAGIIYNNTPSNVKISGYKVLNDNGKSYSMFLVLSTIVIAVDRGADVINMSLGGFAPITDYLLFEDAIEYAYNKKVPVIAAAGNDGCELSAEVPATIFKAITVAAVNPDLTPCDFSNFGTYVDIAAPGRQINSCIPWENNLSLKLESTGQYVIYAGYDYATAPGTSFAAPFVSAAAALLKTNTPSLSVSEIESIIEKSAYVPNNWDTKYGAGILNIANMIGNSSAPSPQISSSGNKAIITSRVPTGTVYFTTDGSDPIVGESNVYTEPFTIKDTDVIKAVAYVEDWLPSKITVYKVRWTDKLSVRFKGSVALPISPDENIVKSFSTNEDIAICEDGIIKGLSVGEATVHVFLETGQKISYDVTVEYETWQKVIIYFLFGFLWYI